VAAEPSNTTRLKADTLVRLESFEPRFAGRVASWVCGPREAYWLAPHTRPPITAHSVLQWLLPGRHAGQLMAGGADGPVGYGEINRLNDRGEFWLGHLIVDPLQRRRGFGVRLVRSLVRHGFSVLGARRVSLVVFAHNEDAIACYRAAGLREEGSELHRFPAYGTTESLLRMVATQAAGG